MTKQQVHEILCSADDKSKMQLAMQCQMNGMDIESLEETLAKALSLAAQQFFSHIRISWRLTEKKSIFADRRICSAWI